MAILTGLDLASPTTFCAIHSYSPSRSALASTILNVPSSSKWYLGLLSAILSEFCIQIISGAGTPDARHLRDTVSPMLAVTSIGSSTICGSSRASKWIRWNSFEFYSINLRQPKSVSLRSVNVFPLKFAGCLQFISASMYVALCSSLSNQSILQLHTISLLSKRNRFNDTMFSNKPLGNWAILLLCKYLLLFRTKNGTMSEIFGWFLDLYGKLWIVFCEYLIFSIHWENRLHENRLETIAY